MKIKYVGLILLCLFAMFTALSCKSTPEAETVVPPPPEAPAPTPERPSLTGLEAAEDRALAARKLVIDFEGDASFPEDWRAASSLLSEADRRKNTSNAEAVRESTARYVQAAEAFEKMSGKVIEKYYENKEAELIAARNAAINAGALELIPDFLFDADNTVAMAVQKYETKDFYSAKDTAIEALNMYQVLKIGLDAYAVREIIVGRGMERYDPRNVEIADDTMYAAADDYEARNLTGARDKVEAALLRYNLSLRTAWESYSADKGAEAADDRQLALNMRANVAVRSEFNAAQEVFDRANTAFRNQRYEDAARGFEDSISRFATVMAMTRVRRAAAEEALERANQVLAESDEIARNAEIILEGGE